MLQKCGMIIDDAIDRICEWQVGMCAQECFEKIQRWYRDDGGGSGAGSGVRETEGWW